jgi:hypothetical protein
MSKNLEERVEALIENTNEICESIRAIHGPRYESSVLILVNFVNVVNAHRSLTCSEHPEEVLDTIDNMAGHVIGDAINRLVTITFPGITEEKHLEIMGAMKTDLKALIHKQRK